MLFPVHALSVSTLPSVAITRPFLHPRFKRSHCIHVWRDDRRGDYIVTPRRQRDSVTPLIDTEVARIH